MPAPGAGPRRAGWARRSARVGAAPVRRLGGVVLLVGVVSCSGEPGDPADATAAAEPARTPTTSPALRLYERTVVFAALDTDSTLVVPWFFSVQDRGDSVARAAQAWLSRNGSWESFLSESWQGPATRAPWRLHPRGPLRFVVGLDDALETVVFDRGPRHLELSFGGMLSEWTPSGDQVFRVHEGSVLLADQRVEGVVLDINRSRPPVPVHGEWAFLTSGDSLFVLVDAIRPSDVPLGGAGGMGPPGLPKPPMDRPGHRVDRAAGRSSGRGARCRSPGESRRRTGS